MRNGMPARAALVLVGLTLVRCSAVPGTPDAGQAPFDAGSMDGGLAIDSGAARDAGLDAGGASDAGLSPDAGATADAGLPPRDAGALEPAWFSDWRTARGTTRQALYDGSKWTGQLCTSNVVEVIDAAGLDFPTRNVYRVEYRMPGECLMVQAIDQWRAVAPGEYLFVRVYYRSALPDGVGIGNAHPFHLGRGPAGATGSYTTLFNITAPTAGVGTMTLNLPDGPPYPDRFWGFGFRTNETYRIELRLFRETATTARVSVRVSDRSGALVAQDADWTNGEPPGHPSRRTLSQSNPVIPVVDASFRLLELGNNDSAGLVTSPGRFIYWGGLAVGVSADPNAWLGPYPTGAEAR